MTVKKAVVYADGLRLHAKNKENIDNYLEESCYFTQYIYLCIYLCI